MAFLRALLRRTAYTLVGLALFGVLVVGAGAALIAYLRSDHCDRLVESLPSPDGAWVIERYTSGCDEASWETLALRRQSEVPGKARHTFLEAGTDYSHGVAWLSNRHLLVAADTSMSYQKKLSNYRGVEISYATYPHDPNLLRDAATASVDRHASLFDARFIKDNGYGLPGVGCNLYLETTAGTNDDRLQMRLSASRVFAIKNSRNGAVGAPEHKGTSLLFSYSTDYKHPGLFATAVGFNQLYSLASQPEATYTRIFKPSIAPAGNLVPSWQTQWALNKLQYLEVLKSIRAERFSISVSYWLSNKE